MYDVYQPLVAVNLLNEFQGNETSANEFLPGLASNWTISASGTTYTFNLRNNVTFSNGDPFNAYQALDANVWLVLSDRKCFKLVGQL